MLDIFTIPRGFEGEFAGLQEAAILSWRAVPAARITLHGLEAGVTAFATRHNITVADVERNERGVPLVRSALAAHRGGPGLFINADNLLAPGSVARTLAGLRSIPRYLAVGRRRNVAGAGSWDWLAANHHEHNNNAVDYHLYQGVFWDEMPPFAVGREHYDHWLVWAALQAGVPVIDVTATMLVYHQDHERKPGVDQREFGESRAWLPVPRCGVEAANYVLAADGLLGGK